MRSVKPYLTTLFFAIFGFILAISLVIFPEASFAASLRGLKIWWDVVFPALLPFFITSEILLGLGLAHFMGVLLEPFMRPVFNIPGSGSFVWTMGFASGYPVSAKLTTRLRERKLISRAEGERLVSYTTTADPVFITGAVAVGFFHSVKVGIVLLVVHYAAAILVGLVMAFHNRKEPGTPHQTNGKEARLYQALRAMHRARIQDGRAFGKLMGDAVAASLQLQLMVGGFMIFFSVFLSLLMKLHIITFFSHLAGLCLSLAGYPAEASQAFVFGLFEVTLGAKQASELFSSDLAVFVIASGSAILAWGGLSVHAQVASILAETDIRYLPFLIGRTLHAVFSFFLTYTAGSYLYKRLQEYTTLAWAPNLDTSRMSLWTLPSYQALSTLACAGILILALFILRLSFLLYRK
jgi:sporulation integral membrane protein YlbJ